MKKKKPCPEKYKHCYGKNKWSFSSLTFQRSRFSTRHHLSFLTGLLITFIIIFLSIISFWYTPYDAYKMDVRSRFLTPSLSHPFGTDEYGRDLLSRCMVGGQIALQVGIISTVIALFGGLIVGFLSGMSNRVVDEILMRLMDGLFAFPAIVFAIAIVSVFGANIVNAMIAIGIVRIPIFARQVRNETISLKQRFFVIASQSIGTKLPIMIWKHFLPHISASLTVLVTTNFAFAILSEAGLSYIGLGTQPPFPSWGRLLMDSQNYMDRAPWLALFPGIMMALTVLGFTLLGNGLRDFSDPRY